MKRKIIIGLNASGFNTSACLFVDGILVFAAEEERFNREKRKNAPDRGVKLEGTSVPSFLLTFELCGSII